MEKFLAESVSAYFVEFLKEEMEKYNLHLPILEDWADYSGCKEISKPRKSTSTKRRSSTIPNTKCAAATKNRTQCSKGVSDTDPRRRFCSTHLKQQNEGKVVTLFGGAPQVLPTIEEEETLDARLAEVKEEIAAGDECYDYPYPVAMIPEDLHDEQLFTKVKNAWRHRDTGLVVKCNSDNVYYIMGIQDDVDNPRELSILDREHRQTVQMAGLYLLPIEDENGELISFEELKNVEPLYEDEPAIQE